MEYSIFIKLTVVLQDFILPPRKASPPPIPEPHSPSAPDPISSSNSLSPLVLHSPISPLSPGSPVYPDGLMNPLWIEKHQSLLPAVFVSFFTLPSSSTNDGALIADINTIKRTLVASTYKTRFVAVLLSEKSILEAPDVDDRLNSIRRGTGLDTKTTLFFIPPHLSTVELETFTATLLTTLQPVCVEYYRDLSKHARRKRNRGTIPPPTAPPTSASKTLGAQGWTVRYEFKLGVFAEFRQEMDAASRSFENAYEGLYGQDIYEYTASWSPRWNELRLLADVITIRAIRSLLWTGQTTTAVRRWQIHITRTREIVDRKGRGSENYGWEAWEANWATTMAELIQTSPLPVAYLPDVKKLGKHAETVIYARPEKAIPIGDRLAPWELLHHPGYWFSMAVSHLRARQKFAQDVPEDDRAPMDQKSSTALSRHANVYETYLCPPPHIESPLPGQKGTDHSSLIVDALSRSLKEFQSRGQFRAAERQKYEIAKEEIASKKWTSAIKILRPLWTGMSWRKEGWWPMVAEVGLMYRNCAAQLGDGGAIIAAEWELMSNGMSRYSDSLTIRVYKER
jgi:trafficking protein particle complex subunit 11